MIAPIIRAKANKNPKADHKIIGDTLKNIFGIPVGSCDGNCVNKSGIWLNSKVYILNRKYLMFGTPS
ncbi:MAG: hypothetical protein A3B99_05165 [Candidatus Yanofskybacteria bacterium RIFCSPHIGHO2_02_FULL_44_12b]|nr:MAG: hypothetical protein A2659_03220 [Candidatus Yanofskybacteria bacterium RIFCSPHIGHO2_01_FULL_44_24]OGN14376.1 MAG: hypothetical protein A3B99_05165 [Candidatus Yanofskybacteria bacterium RIFCSPHIGHO2_02_FULL_44_12b]